MSDESKTRSGKPPEDGDYLWDGTGEPDPEVQRLERLLSPMAYDPARKLPQAAPARVVRRPWRRWAAAGVVAVAAAAVIAVVVWPRRESTTVVGTTPDAGTMVAEREAWA